jgi:hypothetical protein
MNSKLALIALSVLCLTAICCNGGGGGGGGTGGLVVGNIQGPTTVNEGGTAVQYTVTASGDTGITYQWAVDPASAGNFKVNGQATTAFIATPISANIEATIRCVVDSDHHDPVVKELAIHIMNVDNLSVSAIQGPTAVTENSSTDYIVDAAGDTGITYQWSVDPDSAGSFTNPQSPHTVFNASTVTEDKQAILTVRVESDHYDAVVRTLNVVVRDVDQLVVGEIEGPATVLENSETDFHINASGDTGITYLWEVEPPDAGDFENEDTDSAIFTSASATGGNVEATLSVTVESDHYSAKIRTLDIEIEDVDALIVSEIVGPSEIPEDTSVEFTVTSGGDTGITYLWECIPSSAGTWTNEDERIATFHAIEVSEDLPATIRVTVSSDNYADEVRTKEVEIQDIVLEVGPILGQTTVHEDDSVTYSVIASGDSGITYEWLVYPDTAGSIDNPDQASIEFHAAYVGEDLPATLRVVVNSDNYGPTARDLDITVLDDVALTVGEIEGYEEIDEGNTTQYSIAATGDSGITYLWEVDPISAGSFDVTNEELVNFTASGIDDDIEATFTLTVGSDNYPDEVRTLDIDILAIHINVGEIVGPDGIDEDDSGNYSIGASGDSGITYAWEVNPTNAGTFTQPGQPSTAFNPGEIYADTMCTIQVTVDSPNDYPQVRQKEVDLYDTIRLTAEDIVGPTLLDENTPVTYSVSATGDSGIAYSWEVIPSAAGSFTQPLMASTEFYPVPTGVDVNATIRVTVSGDHYPDVVKDLSIRIRDFEIHGWGRSFGGGSDDEGRSVVTDSSGNIYVAGRFQSTVDFDSGDGEEIRVSNGYFDIFLCKYDPAGNLVWAKTWGGNDTDEPNRLIIDGIGNLYVTGYFQGAVDFDPGPAVFQYISNGQEDVFLSKFDSMGNFLWVATWGAEYSDVGYGLVCDAAGNIVVTGSFRSTVDFDPTPDVENHPSLGQADAFFSVFDSSGSFQYAITWGGPSSDYGRAIASDVSSNLYIAGDFIGAVDMDPGSGTYQLTSHSGGTDVFLSKFNSAGNFLWSVNWDAAATDVLIDLSGNIHVTGIFEGTVDFDPSPGVSNLTSNGDVDVFLAKLSPSGVFVRALGWGGSSSDTASRLAVDSLGYIYVAGKFRYFADLDPGPGTVDIDAVGDYDAFLSKFDASGSLVWVRTIGSEYKDEAFDVATYGSSFVYMTGYFESSADFEPGSYADIHVSNGSEDAMLIKYLQNGTW